MGLSGPYMRGLVVSILKRQPTTAYTSLGPEIEIANPDEHAQPPLFEK
jgi:hypothetical protein